MSEAASSMKSAELKWQVSEIAKCPICLDVCKNPKSLPCLHSFCLQCLQQHWKDKCYGDEVPCPVCRKVLAIPYNGLDKLPHNFFLQNLIDADEASMKQSDDALCESCEIYADETKTDIPPATMYCVNCNQKLCERCSRPHKAWKGGPHQVKELEAELTVELLQQRDSYCEQHAGKLLELYCFDCKVNICMKCFAVEHTQHKCREVEKVAEDLMKSSKVDVQQVSTRIMEFHTMVKRTEEGENELLRAFQGADTLVKQRGDELKRMVDTQVDKLLKQLQTVKAVSQKELAGRKDGLELGVTAMESFTAYSHELMSKGSACDITRAASELHARADELLKTYFTPAKYTAPSIKFVPSNIDELTGSCGDDQNLIGRVLVWNIDGSCAFRLLDTQYTYALDAGANYVTGVTQLYDVVYIVCYRFSAIRRFSASTHERLTDIDVKDLHKPWDIASCKQTSQVYIADYEECIWRVSSDGADIRRWIPKSPSDTFTPWRLSVTATRLLVTSYDTNELLQFNACGDELQRVQLPVYMYPCHAVESTTGTFIVSHENTQLHQYQVSEVDIEGQVMRQFSGSRLLPLSFTPHIATDSKGNIFVADKDNHRILLLDAQLALQHVIVDEHQLNNERPWCLCYIKELGKLLVGFRDISVVFVFDVV